MPSLKYFGDLRKGSIITGATFLVLAGLLTGGIIFTYVKGNRPVDNILVDLTAITTSVTLSSFMIHGARKEWREFMLPWLLSIGIGLFYGTIWAIMFIINHGPRVTPALLCPISLWYSWAVVYKYWVYLGNQNYKTLEGSSI